MLFVMTNEKPPSIQYIQQKPNFIQVTLESFVYDFCISSELLSGFVQLLLIDML